MHHSGTLDIYIYIQMLISYHSQNLQKKHREENNVEACIEESRCEDKVGLEGEAVC